MKCPSCNLENLPSSIKCYECGYQFRTEEYYFKLVEDSIRSTGSLHRWFRSLPIPGFLLDDEFRSTLQRFILLPFVWIPGLALWAMDYYERGLAYLVITVTPLIIGFSLFNHWLSNWLIPIGFLVYIWTMVDGFFTWRERHQPIFHSFSIRIKSFFFIVLSICVVVMLWTPQFYYIQLNDTRYQPYLRQGDYLLINRSPGLSKMYRRMDLVLMLYDNKTTFGRIVGNPGERVYFDGNNFNAMTQILDWGLETGESNMRKERFDISNGEYLLVTDLTGPDLRVYDGIGIYKIHDIRGRVEGVIGPTEHRRRIK